MSIGGRLFSLVARAPRTLHHVNRPITTSSLLRTNSIASFEDVKSVKNLKDTVLIDVREPSELQETGVLPHSINIPLGEVESVLGCLPPDEFQKRFNTPKPDFSTPIIFSCYMGKRSASAQQTAARLGFKNVKNYAGGWADWEDKTKSV
ncbi:hypothetical protein Zmor_012701 [Zophobas morio]|uniref:Rhodanese domain-containing protein n=1 Tax=Zophobas morio TaxID=2755281 RepID=A0AA38MEL9_9CUCU|nr:hypothetical protein Zmor_012701 [Zophobas morio]